MTKLGENSPTVNLIPSQRGIITKGVSMASVRLDKFISERTEYTRSQIKELAAKGKITLDGAVVKRCDVKHGRSAADR